MLHEKVPTEKNLSGFLCTGAQGEHLPYSIDFKKSMQESALLDIFQDCSSPSSSAAQKH